MAVPTVPIILIFGVIAERYDMPRLSRGCPGNHVVFFQPIEEAGDFILAPAPHFFELAEAQMKLAALDFDALALRVGPHHGLPCSVLDKPQPCLTFRERGFASEHFAVTPASMDADPTAHPCRALS